TQPDVPEPADPDPEQEAQEHGDAEDVEPPEVGHDPAGGRAEDVADPATREEGDDHEGHDDADGGEKDSGVGLQSQCARDLVAHGVPLTARDKSVRKVVYHENFASTVGDAHSGRTVTRIEKILIVAGGVLPQV